MEAIGKFVVGIVLLVFSVIVRGYTISILWSWFIVPVFNAPGLGIMQAVGVSLVVGVFTTSLRDLDGNDHSYFHRVCVVTLANGFFLLTGFIYTFFM